MMKYDKQTVYREGQPPEALAEFIDSLRIEHDYFLLRKNSSFPYTEDGTGCFLVPQGNLQDLVWSLQIQEVRKSVFCIDIHTSDNILYLYPLSTRRIQKIKSPAYWPEELHKYDAREVQVAIAHFNT